ncbi:unnamed protein product [Trifolium pratense]|uniref:Uncharacterized protein n=1 Tax=Trifolium pratense TaxID=57577 RepID=A0ACB0L010_TRIPR|nr:unnamed protein product [Trifolium pratense]
MMKSYVVLVFIMDALQALKYDESVAAAAAAAAAACYSHKLKAVFLWQNRNDVVWSGKRKTATQVGLP